MIALIDSDILLYEAGFATEDKPEQDAFIRMDERIDAIVLASGADSYQCYLSDSAENNFRYKIDPQYKANRTQPKPIHYEVLKEYLIVEHKAKIAYGKEADDALGIEQKKIPDYGFGESYLKKEGGVDSPYQSTILCTIDKDLRQIPGLHYSWPINRGGVEVRGGEIFEVTEQEGLIYFYKQLIIGDTADNIKGIDGLGPKKTDKLFEDKTIEEIHQLVYELYSDDLERLQRNAQLLWILREENGFIEFSADAISVRKT